MPANLTPQYHKAEEDYRRAQTPEEQIRCLELMLKLIPKHKGTDRLQGDLKRRLKETREEQQREKSSPKSTGLTYRFPPQGAGTIVLIGAPNGGKSRILAELSHAHPEVANYPFCTREPMPGMMPWQDTHVQLIDTPPITESHLEPWQLNLIRSADAILLVMSGASDDAPEETLTVIRELGKRKTQLADSTGFDEENFSIVRVRTLLVVTHAGDPDHAMRLELFDELEPPALQRLTVELDDPASRENLRDAIFRLLNVIRCYTKKPGRPPETDDPFTIPAGGTVEDLAMKVHRELAEKLRYARIWGADVVDGQTVGRDHVLHDRDVVELHW